MTNYDGDIKLSMSLDPKDVKSASKSLQDDIKKIFQQSAGKELDTKFKKLEASMSKAASKAQTLSDKLKKLESTKIPTAEYNEVSKRLEKMNDQFNKLLIRQEEMREAGKTSGAAWDNVNAKMEQLGVLIHEDENELKQLVDTGKAFTLGSETAEYEKTLDQLAGVNNEMRILTSQAEDAAGGTGKFSSAMSAATKILSGFVTICKKVSNALIGVVKSLWGILSSGLKNGIKGLSSALNGMSNSSSKADFSMKKLFWNLMKYGIGIRSLYVLFRRLRSAVTEGINNLVQFNGGVNQANAAMSSLMSSLTYLKNSWAAAFSPILTYVAPALSALINMIANVVNMIGMLFASLTGATSFRRAKPVSQDYAASLSSGGGSKGKSAQEKYEEAQKKAQERYEKRLAKVQEHNAKAIAKAEEKQAKAAKKLADAQKEANEQLAHYDKLNVIAQEDLKEMEMEDFLPDLMEDPELEQIDWEDFLDAGGAGAAIADMFEDVPIDPWIQDLAEKLKKLWNDLIGPIKKAWDNTKDYVVKSFKDMVKKGKSLLKTIFDDALKVWKEAKTQKMFENIFKIAGDIFSIIGNIAEGLEEAWKNNDTGLHILQNIRDIFDILVEHIHNITEGLKEWSKELDFNPIMQAFERFTASLKSIADFLGKVLEDIFNNLVKPLFKYILEDAGPRLLDAITEFNNRVDWEKLRENLNKVWEAIEKLLEGAFNDLANTLGKLGPAIADFLNSPEFAEFCDNVADFITKVGDSGLIEKIFGGLAIVIGDIAKAIMDFVNSEKFQEFMDWLLENIKQMSAEDVAKTIKNVALAIMGFEFAAFVGEGILNVIKFIALLNLAGGAGGGLAGAGKALTTIGTAFSTIAGVIGTVASSLGFIADALMLMEDLDLMNIYHAQNALPQTAKDTNGLVREVDGLNARILDFLGLLPEGVTLGDKMVVPSDYEKLENMVTHLAVMSDHLEETGQMSDEMSQTVDKAYSILGDNLESVENLTDDQVRAFGYLYKEVEKYYNQCENSDAAVEGIHKTELQWEALPNSIPGEEEGKASGKPFANGVVEGVSESFKSNALTLELNDNGKYLVQGVEQGVEQQLAEDEPGSWFSGILDGFLSFFGIGSPSTVMADESQWLVEGIKVGIEKAWPALITFILEELKDILEGFETTWKQLLSNSIKAWTDLKTEIVNKFTELKNKMKDLGNTMKQNLVTLVNSVGQLFDKMKNKVSSTVDSIKSTLRSLVDSVMSAVNSVKNALSNIGSMVSGATSSAVSKISDITRSINVPHLAQGAVIPPNREFMAVLGDQRSGTNIETPLATMVEAFNRALDARGGSSNNQSIVLQLDGEVIAQVVWDEEEKRYKQRGDYRPFYI